MTPDELRKWRLSAKLSQAAAAELIGCSRRALQYYEAGRAVPKNIALAIAAVNAKLKPYGRNK